MTLDEIFAELIEIRSELGSLPGSDPRRGVLEQRRTALHEAARELDPARRSRLQHQVAEAERRVTEVEKMRLDGANMAGLVGVGGGLDPDVLKFINDHIERGHDLAGLRAEAEELRDRLHEAGPDN